jgi:hypothetical protein
MKTAIRLASVLTCAMSCVFGCSNSTRPSAPLAPSSARPTPSVTGVVYSATFTASQSCAKSLPSGVRVRSYTATMTPDGAILWSGPTVHPPNGHNIISAGSFSESRFSFSVGKAHDPQSDAFNGIWDNVSGSEVFNIEGKGDRDCRPCHDLRQLQGRVRRLHATRKRNVGWRVVHRGRPSIQVHETVTSLHTPATARAAATRAL